MSTKEQLLKEREKLMEKVAEIDKQLEKLKGDKRAKQIEKAKEPEYDVKKYDIDNKDVYKVQIRCNVRQEFSIAHDELIDEPMILCDGDFEYIEDDEIDYDEDPFDVLLESIEETYAEKEGEMEELDIDYNNKVGEKHGDWDDPHYYIYSAVLTLYVYIPKTWPKKFLKPAESQN